MLTGRKIRVLQYPWSLSGSSSDICSCPLRGIWRWSLLENVVNALQKVQHPSSASHLGSLRPQGEKTDPVTGALQVSRGTFRPLLPQQLGGDCSLLFREGWIVPHSGSLLRTGPSLELGLGLGPERFFRELPRELYFLFLLKYSWFTVLLVSGLQHRDSVLPVCVCVCVCVCVRVCVSSLVAQMVKNPPAMWETWVQSLGQEDPLEKGMSAHFSILAWRIPWTEEPAGYSPCGCKESNITEWLTLLLFHIYVYTCILEKGMTIHSSILPWKIPWTLENPGGLQSGGVTKSRTWLID